MTDVNSSLMFDIPANPSIESTITSLIIEIDMVMIASQINPIRREINATCCSDTGIAESFNDKQISGTAFQITKSILCRRTIFVF